MGLPLGDIGHFNLNYVFGILISMRTQNFNYEKKIQCGAFNQTLHIFLAPKLPRNRPLPPIHNLTKNCIYFFWEALTKKFIVVLIQYEGN